MLIIGPEKRFENKIKAYIKNKGGWFVKFFANRNTKKGIPDILACINGYFIAIEVKDDHGSPTELQMYNCNKIREAGGLAYVVYPSGFEALKSIIDDLDHDCYDKQLPIIIR